MIDFLINPLVFIFGLIIGSFLNCFVYRLEVNKGFLKGRSFCPICKHELAWQDLIPVLSFFLLKGRCRYCKKPISWQYPLVELATAILFVLVANKQLVVGNPLGTLSVVNVLFSLIISSFFIVIFIYDLKHYIIPDKVICPAILLTLIYGIFYSYFMLHAPGFMLNIGVAAIGAATFFLLIHLVSKGQWLGFGDVKLAFLMGLYLGFPKILVALFLSFLIGAVVGLALVAQNKKSLKSEVPFGPFLTLGTFIALFFGEQLILWYLNLIMI